jgi:hypothetical protein
VDKINQNPGLVIAITVVVLIAAGIWFKTELAAPKLTYTEETAFFTVDNGNSRFEEVVSKVPPFDHDGQPAVRAYVFQCNGNQFVGYLERYTPDGQRMLERIQQQAHTGPPNGLLLQESRTIGREVKRPTDAKWTNGADPKANAITTVHCPDGSGTPEPLAP